VSLLLFVSFFNGCQSQSFLNYVAQKSVIANKAAVAAAHPLATQAGIETLKKGGNAADAAVAVQLALAVVYPRAGNLGGGGFFVYRPNAGEPTTLDFREKAPIKASRDMYLDKNGEPIPNLSQKGHLAAGVPGTIDGCFQIFERYSKLRDWKKVVQPAIDLAEKGFALTEGEATRLNNEQENFTKYSTRPTALTKPNGEKWQKGDVLKQPELAETLKRIRDNGRAGFYEGKTADLIVDEMNRGKGIISHEDLKKYKAVWRKPILGQYRGHDLICMPPPSSGGVALLQLLSIVENYPLSTYGFHSPKRCIFLSRQNAAFMPTALNIWETPISIMLIFKDF
jgi:gamma-glutamyltranspeptidase/glutathione hydrolase